MKYTTLLTYKGTEDYQCKTKEGMTKLYLFENEYGEVDKITRKEEINLKVGDQYKVTLQKKSYYNKKENRRYDSLIYESIEPIK